MIEVLDVRDVEDHKNISDAEQSNPEWKDKMLHVFLQGHYGGSYE